MGEIPRYRIIVSLDADALILTGRQQVFYTNDEDSKLGEIYFRLHLNLPQVVHAHRRLGYRPVLKHQTRHLCKVALVARHEDAFH